MLAFAVVSTMMSEVAALQFPNDAGSMIDLVSEFLRTADDKSRPSKHTVFAQIKAKALKLIAIFLFGSLATFAKVASMELGSQHVGMWWRKRLFSKLMSQRTQFFDAVPAGKLANRLSHDVHEVAEHLAESMSVCVQSAITGALAIGSMAAIAPGLTLMLGLALPATWALTLLYGNASKVLCSRALDSLASATQFASERFRNIRTVRAYARENQEVERYNTLLNRSYALHQALAVYEGAYNGASFMLHNTVLAGVFMAGTKSVLDGKMTVGELASYVLHMEKLTSSVEAMVEGVAGVIKAQGCAATLLELLKLKDERSQGRPSKTSLGTVGPEFVLKLSSASFYYESRPDMAVVKELDLTMKRGDVISLVGRNGCGKSTLAAIIMGLLPITSGAFTLDGVDVGSLDPRWWSQQLGVVQQDPVLFAGTIYQNIAYGIPDIDLHKPFDDKTRKKVEEAARTAQCGFILDLPKGFDTLVGEAGSGLSGGQRQALSIARAIVNDPPILILDEATSALDVEARASVLNSLQQVVKGRLSLVISHMNDIADIATNYSVYLMEEGCLKHVTSHS